MLKWLAFCGLFQCLKDGLKYFSIGASSLSFYSLLLPLILFLHRACLVATIRSSGASQSTIKLVATNLIASGKLAGEHYRGS